MRESILENINFEEKSVTLTRSFIKVHGLSFEVHNYAPHRWKYFFDTNTNFNEALRILRARVKNEEL